LTDRELYAHFWSQSLRDEIPLTDLTPARLGMWTY
jgi:hypothetical protein